MRATFGVLRLAVLASGRGSNLAALSRAFPGQVVLAVSNNPEAPVLDLARAAGAEAVFVPWEKGGRAEFEEAVRELTVSRKADLVLLAGFMRLLSPNFASALRGRLLNVHPSLLPDFPGLRAHEQALAAGVAFTGCTVHFVDAGMDTGDVILQKRVPIREGDTPETLSERLLPAEHEAYPQAVRLVLRGLAFPMPTKEELLAEFGVFGSHARHTGQVRTARLLREWGRQEAVPAVLEGTGHPVAALARDADDLRLAWTSLESLEERLARRAGRETLLERAEKFDLSTEVEDALAVTEDEWERTTY